jgi:hypothetical protein
MRVPTGPLEPDQVRSGDGKESLSSPSQVTRVAAADGQLSDGEFVELAAFRALDVTAPARLHRRRRADPGRITRRRRALRQAVPTVSVPLGGPILLAVPVRPSAKEAPAVLELARLATHAYTIVSGAALAWPANARPATDVPRTRLELAAWDGGGAGAS